MDLIKIGKFIATCRKEKGITQENLAEKLYVTDRAVSKWERGISLPDASKMLDLCKILGITVNELLNGEKIKKKDYDEKTNELLVELTKKEEIKNKRMLMDMWVLMITTLVFYIAIILISSYTLKNSKLFGIIVFTSTLILLIVAFYSFKLEVDAGYYECKNCHHKFTVRYFTAFFAPHINTTRYLKCPKCSKRTWCKKVMNK